MPQFSATRTPDPKPFGREDWWEDLRTWYEPGTIDLLDDRKYEERLHAEFVAAIFDIDRGKLANWFRLMGGNARVADTLLALFPDLKRASVLRAVQRHGEAKKAGRKQQYSVSKPWRDKYFALIERHISGAKLLLLRVYGGIVVSSDHRRRDGENDYAGADIAAALPDLAAAVQGEIPGGQWQFLSTSCDKVEVEITWKE